MIRIAIIDDHEMVRAGLRSILETEPDFEIVGDLGSAEHLEAALDRWKPNIVLLDARLPGTSGAEATRQLRTSHPEVKVLIVSTYSDDALVNDCIQAGADGYVIKSIERFELKQSVRTVAAGEAVLSPSVAGPILQRMRDGDAGQRPELSSSQLRILRLISDGLSNREISGQVHLSENTVKTHIQEIFRSLGARNRVDAVMQAHRRGLL